MFERRIPEWLRHAPAPGVRGFATLAGFEAITRGMLISVFPVALFDALQDASLVSAVYFAIGIVSLITGLLVPYLIRTIPRRWMYAVGASGFVVGSCLAVIGTPEMTVISLALNVSGGWVARRFQLDGVKLHGSRSSMRFLGCPAAMASRVAFR
jgi:hypothetical protein